MSVRTVVMLSAGLAVAAASAGVRVGIELPKSPGRYQVTVAAARADDPKQLVSTFVGGEIFTVTSGTNRFAVEWNGLDDNHMPVPPGRYSIRAVYAPARLWPVDGEYHALTARYAGGIGALLPDPSTPEIWTKPVPVSGDPVNSPLLDVSAVEDGHGTFGFQYMENGHSYPLVRFNGSEKKNPITFIESYRSGGAGGGFCVTTDGTTVWGMSWDNSPDFILRPDGKPFGREDAKYRRGVHKAQGSVTDIVAWKRPNGGSVVAFTENGRISEEKAPRGHMRKVVSDTDFVDRITLLAGADGADLGFLSVRRPRSVAVRGEMLYTLYQPDDATWSVGAFTLKDGLPAGEIRRLFDVVGFRPGDLAVDPSGRIFISDPDGNHVYRLSASGKVELRLGRLDAQESGTYDPATMMRPRSLSSWRDETGRDRLLVVELDGPNRTSEWDAKTGEYIGEYATYQMRCNSGYMVDPENPSHFYVPTMGKVLTRFVFDYGRGTWKTDAVFPNVSCGMRSDLNKAVCVRVKGRLYFASEFNGFVYRMTDDGRRIVRSATLALDRPEKFFWHDANGNGEIDDGEKTPMTPPKGVFTYHGQTILSDLSYVGMGQGTREVWRCAPTSFDAHGNPVYTKWEKVLEDPVYAARAKGNPGALDGGNELDSFYRSDWMKFDGDIGGPVFTQARGGRGRSANYGAQYKITRYDPDGKGGYRMTWRVGRMALSKAGRADLHGGMRLFKPVNGILSVIDQTRSGVYLYSEDGLYLDTLFPPGGFSREIGVYRQPGEFFAGTVFNNRDNGKMYYASGKYTPYLYEIEGWTSTENPFRPVPRHTNFVTLSAEDIADPPDEAVSLRGGVGRARVASFAPAIGGVEVDDGSTKGWEGAPESVFEDVEAKSVVTVQTLWDPKALHLRWHVRKPVKVEYKTAPAPERIFTHDVEADTVGFYFRGDDDARFTFGLFRDPKGHVAPMGVGFYPRKPKWARKLRPQSYRTPVGETTFAHVGPVEGLKCGWAEDKDGRGFVIAASIPVRALPFAKPRLSAGWRTVVNFDANLGGHNRFWWANVDGSASVDTYDEPTEARIYPGSWAQASFTGMGEGLVLNNWMLLAPFGGPGAEKFNWDPRNKKEVEQFYAGRPFAPDDDAYDPDREYAGPETEGYWGKPKSVRWRRTRMAELDNRAVFADRGAQVCYGATFITSPEEREVTLELYSHAQTFLEWKLNGESMNIPNRAYRNDPNMHYRRLTETKVTLRKGVNELRFRGFCVGYAPIKVGVTVRAPEEFLWRLDTSVPQKSSPAAVSAKRKGRAGK